MIRTSSYIFGIMLIFLFSCRKNELPPQEPSGEPVFFFTASINGTAVNMEAGKHGYFMRSSHIQDTSGVYVYRAELERINCSSDCGYVISLMFNDHKVSASGESMSPDQGLFVGEHDFTDPNMRPLEYIGKFSSNMPTTTSFTWTYEPNKSDNNMSGEYVFKSGQAYSLHLNVNNFGCATSHSNMFRVGHPLQTNVSVQREQPTTIFKYKFNALPTVSVSSYQWDFGDGSTSSEASPSHTYSSEGAHLVKLRLIGSGDTCYSVYQLAATNANTCHANFTSTFTPVPNTKALNGVSIKIRDSSTGKIYSSSSLDQSTSNKFEVVSVENYKENERGERTKKVRVRFSCDLMSGSDLLSIRNAEAVIAVSYH